MDALIAIREPDGSFSRADAGLRTLYSITKTFIAAGIDALGIDDSQSVADWIDGSWLPRGREISVRQLLTHSGSLRD